jgi:DNA-binding NtrC family response regulator
MASNLLGCQLTAQRVYTAGSFSLQRFITDLHLKDENHIGEAIVRDNGELEHLKTYRLSAAQTRRVYLLSQLAACGWQLDRAAERLGNTREDFVLRLEKAGFGYLLNNQLLERARKYQRQSHSR